MGFHGARPVPYAYELVKDNIPGDHFWPSVEQSLQTLPYWKADQLISNSGDWKTNVLERLASQRIPATYCRRTKCLLGTPEEKLPYRIVVQVLRPECLQLETDDNGQTQDADGEPDAIETLFVRINSAGTPLEGEELRYSILKSAFPDAQGVVEHLGGTNLMSPARLVTFVSRLVLARMEKAKDEPPREPDVARFRRLINDPHSTAFRDGIRCYLGIEDSKQRTCETSGVSVFGRAKELLDSARALLVNGNWGLPPVLMAELAQSTEGVEAIFFLLTWLDRMFDAGLHVTDICDDDRRRLVGTVTTLGWFGERPFDCLKTLWRRMSDERIWIRYSLLAFCLIVLKPTHMASCA